MKNEISVIMGMTITEKILAAHSGKSLVVPGDIIDVVIDARVARDFGGANVVNNIEKFNLGIDDPGKTFFTFDCNPGGSDQKYAVNQHFCRLFARRNGIRIFDINKGIGTHLLIEEGLAWPGSTAVSTDSHANILGAIGCFGQGMGDRDIAVAWSKGSVWFKVPPSVRFNLIGNFPEEISAKDIALNLLEKFGANQMLGFAIEMYGECLENLSLDDRITISSMATEMGAIILIFPPNNNVIRYCESRSGKKINAAVADIDAVYKAEYDIDVSSFIQRVSRPGQPHDAVDVQILLKTKIDSAFIGSCTNGRIEDMRVAASILKNRKVAPGVVLKIVPATDLVWQRCLDEGIIDIFKEAGALVSNAGCGGCAEGQVGQNGVGEITISTGNRNFPGKQGKGEVYLSSPEIVAASAIAGYITTASQIPELPAIFDAPVQNTGKQNKIQTVKTKSIKATEFSGRAWLINKDNIDTDMIYHNSWLTVTDSSEMAKYTFGNMENYKDFSRKAKKGDILFTGKNFGSGSSRQQAVDCFKSLGIQAIVAESFGAIYERNAINAAFPVIICEEINNLEIEDGDEVIIDLRSGKIQNKSKNKFAQAEKFSDVQMEIFQNGGLF